MSIVMAAYNTGAFIREAIDSVLNQSHKDFELIVINDGSTDQTEEILNSYTDPRLRIVKQSNQGASSAKWAGVEHATGEYLYFVDSDDVIHVDTVRACFEAANDGDIDIVFFGFELFESDSRAQLGTHLPPYPSHFDGKKLYVRNMVSYLGNQNHIFPARFMKRSLVRGKESFYTGLPFFEELVSFTSVFNSESTFRYLPQAFYYYRVNRPGQSIQNWATTQRSLKLSCLHATVLQTLRQTSDEVAQTILLLKLVEISKYDLSEITKTKSIWTLPEEASAFSQIFKEFRPTICLRALFACPYYKSRLVLFFGRVLPKKLFGVLVFNYLRFGRPHD